MSNIENEPTVGVSLTVKNAAEALEFYTKAFGAKELFRMPMPCGDIAHAEFMIGNTLIYISGESPEWHAFAMTEGVMASSLLGITTESCDDSYKQAMDAGGESLNSPQDNFWGFRTAVIKDPYGYRWSFRQLIEEVSQEEMMIRAKKLFGGE